MPFNLIVIIIFTVRSIFDFFSCIWKYLFWFEFCKFGLFVSIFCIVKFYRFCFYIFLIWSVIWVQRTSPRARRPNNTYVDLAFWITWSELKSHKCHIFKSIQIRWIFNVSARERDILCALMILIRLFNVEIKWLKYLLWKRSKKNCIKFTAF